MANLNQNSKGLLTLRYSVIMLTLPLCFWQQTASYALLWLSVPARPVEGTHLQRLLLAVSPCDKQLSVDDGLALLPHTAV